jgi:hypothetical protein
VCPIHHLRLSLPVVLQRQREPDEEGPNEIIERTKRTIPMTSTVSQSDHGAVSHSTSHLSKSSSLESDAQQAAHRPRMRGALHAKTCITVSPACDAVAAHQAPTNGSSNGPWQPLQARPSPGSDGLVVPPPHENMLSHNETTASPAQATLVSDNAASAEPRHHHLWRLHPKRLTPHTNHHLHLMAVILPLTTVCFSTFPVQSAHPPAPVPHVGTEARLLGLTGGG